MPTFQQTKLTDLPSCKALASGAQPNGVPKCPDDACQVKRNEQSPPEHVFFAGFVAILMARGDGGNHWCTHTHIVYPLLHLVFDVCIAPAGLVNHISCKQPNRVDGQGVED